MKGTFYLGEQKIVLNGKIKCLYHTKKGEKHHSYKKVKDDFSEAGLDKIHNKKRLEDKFE